MKKDYSIESKEEQKINREINRLRVLYQKGQDKSVTKGENQEFKRLEKSITEFMLHDEVMFDRYIVAYKRAINQ